MEINTVLDCDINAKLVNWVRLTWWIEQCRSVLEHGYRNPCIYVFGWLKGLRHRDVIIIIFLNKFASELANMQPAGLVQCRLPLLYCTICLDIKDKKLLPTCRSLCRKCMIGVHKFSVDPGEANVLFGSLHTAKNKTELPSTSMNGLTIKSFFFFFCGSWGWWSRGDKQ